MRGRKANEGRAIEGCPLHVLVEHSLDSRKEDVGTGLWLLALRCTIGEVAGTPGCLAPWSGPSSGLGIRSLHSHSKSSN